MMQFTLSHEDIRSALAEHIRKKGVVGPISFTIKTSRKGDKTSTAFVTVLDVPQVPVRNKVFEDTPVETEVPKVSAGLTNQPADPVKAHIDRILAERMDETEEEEDNDYEEDSEEIQDIQTKRLFA
jgi:hypothetical protein